MKKSTLEKKIKELGKYLGSEGAKSALETLRNELKNYSEPSSDSLKNTGEFTVPAEILGKSHAYALFTDGACRGNPGPGSYAFMVQKPSGEIVCSDAKSDAHTTNNKMELSAVIKGLEKLSSEITPFDEIHVYTDSKYVVDGIKTWVAGWKKRGWKKADKKEPENLSLWKALDHINSQMNCSFHWVKGHAGHPQNEHVDQLANIVLDQDGY